MMGGDLPRSDQKEEMPPDLPNPVKAWAEMFGYDASTSRLYCLIVAECSVNAFKALIGEVGPSRAIDVNKPVSNTRGRTFHILGNQRFGPLGTDAEGVAMPYYWLHCGSSHGNIKPMEIRDGMAIIELYYCPFASVNAPPEACIALSHEISKGLCEVTNPDYEFVWTHHLVNGDGRCRYVVKKKSIKFKDVEMGKLERTVPLEMSKNEMELIEQGVVFGTLNAFTDASVGTIGSQRTIELITPMARDMGLRLGIKLKDAREGLEDDNIFSISSKLDYLSSVLNRNGPPSMISDSIVEREITDCPFKGSAPEVCKQFEAMFNGVCEAINPDYEFAYDRMMSKGDSTCHWVVKKRESMRIERVDYSTLDESPARALALKFAKNEISQDEFDMRMEMLRKKKVKS